MDIDNTDIMEEIIATSNIDDNTKQKMLDYLTKIKQDYISIKKKVYNEGYDEGYNDGYEEGSKGVN